jgi:selT/selW/selH-like putative selenoprotein
LAAELRGRFPDAQIQLVPSSGGRFEVSRDGVPVFEKSKTGRHARPGEIVALLLSAGGES